MGDHRAVAAGAEDVLASAGSCQGFAAADFQRVADAFASNFDARGEQGASVCIYRAGRLVVDMWGGMVDAAAGSAWQPETVSLVFSATKAATALCIHLLADRGEVDIDRPVAAYWPEFAQNGKAHTSIRMVLDHTAGLPALRDEMKADCLTDHDYMVRMIGRAAPEWEPGSRTAYHPLIGGFILAEIVRRVDGRSLGMFFADEIARPLDLDFWIGLPEAEEARVAPILSYRSPKDARPTRFSQAVREAGTLQNLFFFNHGDWQTRGMNTRVGRASEIGAAGGITNASSLARLYAALVPDGPLGLSEETLAGFSQASSATHLDGMLLQPTRFGPGFMLRMDNRSNGRGNSLLIGPQAFGHVGAGGSVGFYDPDARLAFAYTMNRMGPGFLVNERGQSLIDAAYECIVDRGFQEVINP